MRICSMLFTVAVFAPLAALAQSPSNAALVDISRFRATHPNFSFSTDAPASERNGQIPFYGGPVQTYFNSQINYILHDVIAPFGGRVTVPLAHGRVELLASTGGIFVPLATPYSRQNSWVTQTTIGARVALDQGHHFWIGGSARHITNVADKTRQWGLLTGDFTFQSGH